MESTAAWGMHPTTATWGVHPTSATKSMHMTLGGGQATACKERYPYSHGYHYRLHFFAPLENCVYTRNVPAKGAVPAVPAFIA